MSPIAYFAVALILAIVPDRAWADGSNLHCPEDDDAKLGYPVTPLPLPVYEKRFALPDHSIKVHLLGPPDPGVTVRAISGPDERVMKPGSTKGIFLATDLPPGVYTLTAQDAAGHSIAPERRILLGEKGVALKIHPTEGSLFYRLGDSLVPFQPSPDLVAIYFESGALSKNKAMALLNALVEDDKLPLESPDGAPLSHWSFSRFDGQVWIFRLTNLARREQTFEAIRKQVEPDSRVGMPINYDEKAHALTVLDNQFVIAPEPDIAAEALQTWFVKYGARKIGPVSKAGKLLAVEFDDADYTRHLIAMDCGVANKLFRVAEPDLVFTVFDHATGWPSDPRYWSEQWDGLTQQKSHSIQMIRDAWKQFPIDPNMQGWSSRDFAEVTVGILDQRVTPELGEFNCAAGDGNPQIALCFNAGNGTACTPQTRVPFKTHGLGVFGIIGACFDGKGLVGAAPVGADPAAHFTTVIHPSQTSGKKYAQTLEWMAGLPRPPCPNPTCNWPTDNPPVDVINASHGANGATGDNVSSVRCAFQNVIRDGRQGKGAILVYSAGNVGDDIAAVEPYAADSRTIAVSNCRIVAGQAKVRRFGANGSDPEEVAGASNWGEAIEICAVGYQVPTVSAACATNLGPGEMPLLSSIDPDETCYMTAGTSAAAPFVSAAAALVLSKNKDLTWSQVKALLGSTARQTSIVFYLPDDSAGQFDAITGHSTWYGFGLLDAERAVIKSQDVPASDNIVMPDPACLE
jgi:hypothetical protein